MQNLWTRFQFVTRVGLILGGALFLIQHGTWAAQAQGANTLAPTAPFVQFSDVTRQAKLPRVKARTRGIAWGDFDNDGWQDLFVGHHAARPDLFRNQGDGTYVNVTASAGIDGLTDRHACQWGDFNNDRWIDLYCSAGAARGMGSKPNQLWQNNGAGSFQDVAASMGVIDGVGRGRSVNWFDYNNDGLLDLFLGNALRSDGASQNRLYRNEGATFSDVAAQVGLIMSFSAVASAVTDYNQDGLWDLSIATDEAIYLFKHTAADAFREQSPRKTGLQVQALDALTWGDYDNDGYADLAVAARSGAIKLFHNNRNGKFSDVTSRAKIPQAALPAQAARWADLNNDGWLDLLIVRRGVTHTPNAPDLLLQNLGNGAFKDVTGRARLAGPAQGQGETVAAADYDNDGFLDLFVNNGAGAIGSGFLYRNLGNANHWLTLQLRGTRSNALAIGSKIWVTTDNKTQYREYLYENSNSGQSAIRAHFGLAQDTIIQVIKIRWPDGQVQELLDVPADQHLVIEQP